MKIHPPGMIVQKLQQLPKLQRIVRSNCRCGFSLIEVALALGIISFALLAVVGLLPAGLEAQRQSANQARSVQVLSEISDALRGVYLDSGSDYKYPYPLDAVTPGAQGEQHYDLQENGRLVSSGDNVQGVVYLKQYPKTTNQVIPVYVSIAWPGSAERKGDAWDKAQGSVESLIFVNPQ